MRIAFFTPEFPPLTVGGLGVYSAEISYAFSREGHYVDVFTLGSITQDPLDELSPNFLVHRFKTTLDPHSVCEIGNAFCYNIGMANLFFNEIDKGKCYDVVAINDWLSSVAGLIIKEKCKLPIFFHLHSNEPVRMYGGGSEIIKTLEWLMVEACNRIIVKCYAMQDAVWGEGYPTSKISLVYSGCDPLKYDPVMVNESLIDELRAMYGVEPGDKVVLFIGRITWIKGVEPLLVAFRKIVESEKNVKLIILGVPGDAYDGAIETATRLNLQDYVRFRFELVPEQEKIAHYGMSDLCVFPSLAESSGLACLEAMSMAKPVVVGATGVSVLREFVVPAGPEQNGVHVNPKDPDDLARGIKWVLSNPSREKIGRKGRDRVVSYFSWKNSALKTLDLYKDSIKGLTRKLAAESDF